MGLMAKKRNTTTRWFSAIMLMSMLSLVFFLVPTMVQAEKDAYHEDHHHATEEASSHESHGEGSHKDHITKLV